MKKHFVMMLALAVSLPSVAMAADDRGDISVVAGETYSRPVNVDDLDLTRAAGQAALRTRLNYAVRQVCGTAGSTGPLIAADHACMNEASAKAQEQAQVLIASATRQASTATAHGAN